MKNLLALLALALLLLALPASAANVVRTSSAACYWATISTGCSWTGGGTPDVSDHFTIAHNVVMQTSLAITTGSVSIAAAGVLTIPPGITLQFGDGSSTGGNPATVGLSIETGGTLNQNGALIQTCRIASQPNWSAAVAATHTVTATLDCDLTNVSTTTDYVFFGDEDPADLDAVLTGKCVHAGPGVAPPGCHRPAYNKWSSYKITGASGRSLTYDLDPQAGNYTAGGSAPYAGSRYLASATPIDVSADLTYAVRWLGRRTAVTIGAGSHQTTASIIAGDRGSWYLAYDEVPSIASDPTACSGLHAKILHATTGASDVLEVEGDVSHCTHASATAQITPGARRGDIVHIYRPATLSGDTNAAGVGEGGIANGGGHWYARWARINKPFGIGGATFTPNTSRAGAVQFYQGSATAQPTADWDWVDIAYPGFTAAADVGVLHFVSSVSATNLRYPNNGLLDMTGSEFRHIHIHDSINNGAGGGGHGVYVDSARGVDVSQFRDERINDDCIGSFMVRSDGTVVQANELTLRHALVYECIAETANSQQGIELSLENDGTGGDPVTGNVGLTTRFTLQDVLSIGHATQPLGIFAYRTVLKGITTGGIQNATASTNVFVRIDGGGAQASLSDATVGAQLAYASHVSDSNLYVFGPTTASFTTQVAGDITGSFIAGNDQTLVTAATVGYTSVFRGTVVDLAAGNSGGYAVTGSASTPFYSLQASFKDTVLRSTTAGAGTVTRLATNLAPSTGGFQHQINRLALLFVQASADDLLATFASGGSIANATTTVNGLFVSNSGTTGDSSISQAGTNVVVDVQSACIETTAAIGAVFAGGAANGTTKVATPTLVPSGADPIRLRDLVAQPGDTGCHGRNLPARLGYENFRVSHAMLGDFEILQVDRSSSDDLIRISPPFSHPRGQRDN